MSILPFAPGSVPDQDWFKYPFPPIRRSDITVVPGTAVTSSRQLLASGNVVALCGWALAETTGTAGATVRIHDGLDANEAVFARINLASNESTRDMWGYPGVKCTSGNLYLEVVSGSIEGVIFWR